MTAARPKRAMRQEPGRKRLVVRDLVALGLVGDAWPVTTRQVAAFVECSRPIASRLLRKLRDLALVAVHVEGMESENRYTLMPAGARELARVRGVDPDAFATPTGLGRVSDHHHGVVDVYVALHLALRRSTRLTLARFAFEAELRRRVGTTKYALVPDGVAVVVDEDGHETTFALEVDQATQNPSYVLREKIEPYIALAGAGAPLVGVAPWRVLFVVPTERRARKLAEAIWEAEPPDGLFFIAVAGELDDRTILSASWRTPRLHASGEHLEFTSVSPWLPVNTTRDNGFHGIEDGAAAIRAGFGAVSPGPFVPRGLR